MINPLRRARARFICRWRIQATMVSEAHKWRAIISSSSNRCPHRIMFKKVLVWPTNNSYYYSSNSSNSNSKNWQWLSNKDSHPQISTWSKVELGSWANRCHPPLKRTWWVRATGGSSWPRSNSWYSCNNCKKRTKWPNSNSRCSLCNSSSNYSSSNSPSKK